MRRNPALTDASRHAKEALSGKRAALVGFSETAAREVEQVITMAEAFTRSFSPDIPPSAEALKPFELILISLDHAAGTEWLDAQQLGSVIDRCVGVGPTAVLLTMLAEARLSYPQVCAWPAAAEELLLRCMLALRSAMQVTSRALVNGSTIVLADDDPSITALVRLTLQRNDMTCEVASNGGAALELINRLKPCAAVLDVGMPGINGFEVLSRIRSVPELAQTRVILLTGCEQEADILRGFSLGADDYVIKPFNPMELMMRVKRAIGRI